MTERHHVPRPGEEELTGIAKLFRPGSPIFYLVALAATGIGVAFVGAGGSVAMNGTGADLPTGPDVVEGLLVGIALDSESDAPQALTDSPVGEPFLYGEVTLGRPGSSGAVDHRWRDPAGNAHVIVDTNEGEREIHLPAPHAWRGLISTEERVVENLSGYPIVRDVELSGQNLAPPFAIGVRALRPGDAVLARLVGDEDDILLVGTRDSLQSDLDARESMRWPIVVLMSIMGFASLLLGYRSLGRAQATPTR